MQVLCMYSFKENKHFRIKAKARIGGDGTNSAASNTKKVTDAVHLFILCV